MRRIILFMTICILVFSGSVNAAEKVTIQKPDFESIKAAVNDSESDYYYPKLFKKFCGNDTVMTIDEYRHLYYGYMFQEDYNPYRRPQKNDNVDPLYFKNKHSKEECDTIMKYAEINLADNPFDLRQMMFFVIALKEKRKYARASILQFKLNHLVLAIMSSGDGTKDNPWYVISPMHEYNLLNFMNYVVEAYESVEDGVLDYLKIKKVNDKTPEGYYFNVAKVLEMHNKKF